MPCAVRVTAIARAPSLLWYDCRSTSSVAGVKELTLCGALPEPARPLSVRSELATRSRPPGPCSPMLDMSESAVGSGAERS